MLQNKTRDCYGSDDFEKIVVINKAANQLLLIIDDILDLSRIESGRVELNESYFMMGDLVKDLSDLYGPQFEDNNLNSSFDIDFNYKLFGDRKRYIIFYPILFPMLLSLLMKVILESR